MTKIVNLQTSILWTVHFAGESEDRPTPSSEDTHVQSSVVDCGRPIAPVNRQSYSPASTTTTSLTGRSIVPVPHLPLLLVDLPR